MRRVWILVVCLTVPSFAAAQDSSKKEVDAQTAAVTKQITSELLTAVQHSNVGDIADDPKGKIAGLVYDVRMSDCENRWVALYHKPEEADYTYGFVYIDPQAGFTLHYFGIFTIDAGGNYHAAPNPIPPDKASLKIRLDQNGIAALLPTRALTQLELPQRPDWMKYYEDKADPVTHKVNWGFFYNGIGDSQRALGFLESAYKERPDAPRVVFELTYAYNAVGRPEDAIRVAKSDFAKNPQDELLCREIAFAYLNLKNYKEAIGQHQACIALCGDSEFQMAEKSELAMNLGSAYGALGDTANRNEWLEKAKTWAPKGSPVYKYFHLGEEQ
jgi:tetratricopeptide (TPR) repeat protein